MAEYASRTRERVQHRWMHDDRATGGELWGPTWDEVGHLCWVYRREDGTEYVGLKQQVAVKRDGQQAYVERLCKAVRAYDMAGLLARLSGGG